MKRRKSLKLSDLLVADSAKAVIEGFLDAECVPTILRSPLKAEGLKNIIMGEICLSLSHIRSSSQNGDDTTKELAQKLRAVAKAYSRDGRIDLWHHFLTLSGLLESVIS